MWSPWTSWTACGATCGDAVQTRRRICLNAREGFENCPGSSSEATACDLPVSYAML